MSRYQTKTAKLYNAGLTLSEAVLLGADREEFLSYEDEFKDGSIPCHLINGFKYSPPYSCEYHTGGKISQQLRDTIK